MKAKLNKYGLEPILTTKEIAVVIGVPLTVLEQFSKEVTNHYHPFKKEREGKKPRKIANPDKPLKAIQRKIVKRILEKVILPEEMNGAVKGKSLKENAAAHLKKPVVVAVDIRDCFPSVSYKKIFRLFRENFGFSEEVSSLLTKLCTYRGCLPQGAPTSSALLNIYLIPLCLKLRNHFKEDNFDITFWVDDIAFSGKKAFLHIQYVAREIQKMGLALRASKIKIMRKGSHQEVAGLTVNDIVSVPQRKLKKYLEDVNWESTEATESLLGRMNYIDTINPNQGKNFRRKLLAR